VTEDLRDAFRTARPIWPEGREREMNRFAGFRAVLPAPEDAPVVLHVAASSVYRVFVNGAFVGHGPARGPHGRFRVDAWTLDPWLREGTNLIAIEAVGYNVNSYYLLDQPAFVLAEVRAGDRVLASTGGEGVRFEAVLPVDHVQRVERYSVARTFSEAFRLRPGGHAWRTDADAAVDVAPCAVGEVPPLLPRRVPYPDFRLVEPPRVVARGHVARGAPPAEPYRDWTLTELGPTLKGYREEELEVTTSLDWQAVRLVAREAVDVPFALPLDLPAGTFTLLDFDLNQSGFLGLRLRCDEPARLYAAFDELLADGMVDARRLRCLNVLDFEISLGVYDVETFEPYTLRYLQLAVLDGGCTVEAVTLRRYDNPEARRVAFASGDLRLETLFEAGRETLAPNALDLLTDCPSRERAGWPCDSFFTARAAHLLTGSTAVEKAFLENYALAPPLPELPEGMLPMNYPADHPNGLFIPNWPLWLVLQLEEYLERSGDRALVDAFASKVRALFAYFDRFAIADGLLEDLESWVFVEWSKANAFTAGVNYPTNALYAAALDAAGRLYDEGIWREQARRLRAVVAEQSFEGRFFVDQALREDGALRRTEHRTEIAQYYAFYFGVATPETHGALWETLRRDFGPRRDAATYPEVHPAAMLNGYFLRLELLARYGHGLQAVEEALDYFLPMAEATGTLWEHAAPTASCCHGFASHVCVLLHHHASDGVGG
jgi:alpha-L-rhamnosidase